MSRGHSLVKKGQFSVRCSPKAAPRSVTPWLKKGPFFGEVFTKGSLPERDTLFKKEVNFGLGVRRRQAPGASHPGFKKGSIFGEVFAEGKPPERHSLV